MNEQIEKILEMLKIFRSIEFETVKANKKDVTLKDKQNFSYVFYNELNYCTDGAVALNEEIKKLKNEE